MSQSFGILLEEMIFLVKCVCVSITGHRQNNRFQTLYSAANSFSYCVKVVKQVVFCFVGFFCFFFLMSMYVLNSTIVEKIAFSLHLG